MKIPKSIHDSAIESYSPSEQCLNLAGEKGRRIHAWNGNLPDNGVLRLEDLAVNILPASTINQLPTQLASAKHLLVETVATDIPLTEASKEIPDGDYWQRRFQQERPNDIGDVQIAGGSWKRLFMEKFVKEKIENMFPKEEDNEKDVMEVIKTAEDFVHILNIEQLRTNRNEENRRINLTPYIAGFKLLTELHIKFGIKKIGTDYEKEYFEVTEPDCRNIGNGVAQAKNLRVLRIHHSLVDDPKIMILLKHMHGNTSLKTLDFSHCRIGDQGAVSLAEFAGNVSTLENIILTNNRILSGGAVVLASYLNGGVKCLNLRFNPIGDEGGIAILKNGTFHSLNLACCELGKATGFVLKEILCTNGTLRELDISNNHLGKEVGAVIKLSMAKNKTIEFMDVRMTDIGASDQIAIEQCLARNRNIKSSN